MLLHTLTLFKLYNKVKTQIEEGINSYIKLIPMIFFTIEFPPAIYNDSMCKYKFTFDKKLPPDDMSGEKKPNDWWSLFATSCENIRDTAYATGAIASGALANQANNVNLNINEQSSPIESFTSYVEDSDPKNAEAFFNI